MHRWTACGKLHVIHRGVYALGHASVPIEGAMVAALLRAGPSAVLSHRTAAWWWGLLDKAPAVIEVSTRSKVGSTSGVVVHHPRQVECTRHRRFPITPIARTFLDIAAQLPLNQLRRALAEGDYRGLLDLGDLEAAAGRGRPESANLRRARERHQPQLAHTRSPLEVAFFTRCEASGVPVPEMNARVVGWTVDALWREERLAVELDGHGNHRTPAQLDRDHRKELSLRTAGLMVVRYSEPQVRYDWSSVLADLLARLQQARTGLGPAPAPGRREAAAEQ